jgi:hypothetical protein
MILCSGVFVSLAGTGNIRVVLLLLFTPGQDYHQAYNGHYDC